MFGLWGHSGSHCLRHFVTKCGKSEGEEKRWRKLHILKQTS